MPDVDRIIGDDPDNTQQSGLSTGAIAAIIIAAILWVCACLYLGYKYKKKGSEVKVESWIELLDDEVPQSSVHDATSQVSAEAKRPSPDDDSSVSSLNDEISQAQAKETYRVTVDDLKTAIEAGDWATVGTLAAQLADPPQWTADAVQSNELNNQQSSRSLSSEGMESIDSSSNITEMLHKMVERLDWEGIVLAAAQFEGRDSTEEVLSEEAKISVNEANGPSPSASDSQQHLSSPPLSNGENSESPKNRVTISDLNTGKWASMKSNVHIGRCTDWIVSIRCVYEQLLKQVTGLRLAL